MKVARDEPHVGRYQPEGGRHQGRRWFVMSLTAAVISLMAVVIKGEGGS